MTKIAFFVEGYTELVFVEKLILEVFDQSNVRIELRRITGGSSVPRHFRLIRAANAHCGEAYFVLIIDCVGGDTVKSRIVEEYDNLSQQGYDLVIGLRDVYPLARAEIPKLEQGLRYRVRTVPLRVEFVLAVMEVEAWFLAEFSHFERIDQRLTCDLISASLGFDPRTDLMDDRQAPAEDLSDAYQLVGRPYLKHQAPTTIGALDFPSIYLDVPSRSQSLGRLVSLINEFV